MDRHMEAKRLLQLPLIHTGKENVNICEKYANHQEIMYPTAKLQKMLDELLGRFEMAIQRRELITLEYAPSNLPLTTLYQNLGKSRAKTDKMLCMNFIKT